MYLQVTKDALLVLWVDSTLHMLLIVEAIVLFHCVFLGLNPITANLKCSKLKPF